jgi:hypothetical protein
VGALATLLLVRVPSTTTDGLAPQTQTIGLVGGLSYASTLRYYKELNKGVAEQLGGLHSSRMAIVSLDLAEYAEYLRTEEPSRVIQMVRSCGPPSSLWYSLVMCALLRRVDRGKDSERGRYVAKRVNTMGRRSTSATWLRGGRLSPSL